MRGTRMVASRAAIREMNARVIMISHSSGCGFHSSEDSTVVIIPSAIILMSGYGNTIKVSDWGSEDAAGLCICLEKLE
jgi:hypothetical protein